MISTRRYLRISIGNKYITIEILGENYFYARAVFNYMPYQTKGSDMSEVILTLIKIIKNDDISIE